MVEGRMTSSSGRSLSVLGRWEPFLYPRSTQQLSSMGATLFASWSLTRASSRRASASSLSPQAPGLLASHAPLVSSHVPSVMASTCPATGVEASHLN